MAAISTSGPTIQAAPLPSPVVMEELERISKSAAFRRSERLFRLLEYAVTSSLSQQPITERLAAGYLFGDRPGFNPSLDPTVRVLFGRLRKRLDVYYSSEGAADPIRILIPERSYSPVFEVVADPKSASVDGQGSSTPEPVASAKPSLAVLPFLNLTNDPKKEVYCAGLTDELISALAAVPTVDVVARSSAFQFKDEPMDVRTVGQELGVDLILEGSVKIEGDETRITAQLATVKDGFALWANSYNGPAEPGSGSMTQAQIASRIVHALPLAPAV